MHHAKEFVFIGPCLAKVGSKSLPLLGFPQEGLGLELTAKNEFMLRINGGTYERKESANNGNSLTRFN